MLPVPKTRSTLDLAPTTPCLRYPIAPDRKAPAPLPAAQSIAAGAQADRSTDRHHHTHIPLPSASAPANPPPAIAEHWQRLLSEKTALLGYKITPPPESSAPRVRPTFAKRSLHPRSASAQPAHLAHPGLSDRSSLAQTDMRSYPPPKTTVRPPRIPRRRRRFSSRRAEVSFRVAA